MPPLPCVTWRLLIVVLGPVLSGSAHMEWVALVVDRRVEALESARLKVTTKCILGCQRRLRSIGSLGLLSILN